MKRSSLHCLRCEQKRTSAECRAANGPLTQTADARCLRVRVHRLESEASCRSSDLDRSIGARTPPSRSRAAVAAAPRNAGVTLTLPRSGACRPQGDIACCVERPCRLASIAVGPLLADSRRRARRSASESFVASSGFSDTNPELVLPCASYAADAAQTNSGGEVIVLDSAGYDPERSGGQSDHRTASRRESTHGRHARRLRSEALRGPFSFRAL